VLRQQSLWEASIDAHGERVALTPGMDETAEVKTGNRRVLEFLLDPLMEMRDEASHERSDMKRAVIFSALIVLFLIYAVMARFMYSKCVEWNLSSVNEAEKKRCSYAAYFNPLNLYAGP
jgi:hypothetical protein